MEAIGSLCASPDGGSLMTMQIESENLEAFIRQIGRPDIVRSPMRGLLLRAGNKGRSTVRREVRGGANSIGPTIVRLFDRRDFTVTVKSAITNDPRKVPRMRNIERGRPIAGPLPNSEAIQRWLEVTGKASEAQAINKTMRIISARGTRGKHMFAKAREAIKQNMPRYIRTAARQIERNFLKKTGSQLEPGASEFGLGE